MALTQSVSTASGKLKNSHAMPERVSRQKRRVSLMKLCLDRPLSDYVYVPVYVICGLAGCPPLFRKLILGYACPYQSGCAESQDIVFVLKASRSALRIGIGGSRSVRWSGSSCRRKTSTIHCIIELVHLVEQLGMCLVARVNGNN